MIKEGLKKICLSESQKSLPGIHVCELITTSVPKTNPILTFVKSICDIFELKSDMNSFEFSNLIMNIVNYLKH